jgi:hypothetical protein
MTVLSGLWRIAGRNASIAWNIRDPDVATVDPVLNFRANSSHPVNVVNLITSKVGIFRKGKGTFSEIKRVHMKTDNIIPFPLERRRQISVCPHCGTRSNVWLIGRLLWGYCNTHELRWVVTDYHRAARATINRRELTRGLEFLSSYSEISA